MHVAQEAVVDNDHKFKNYKRPHNDVVTSDLTQPLIADEHGWRSRLCDVRKSNLFLETSAKSRFGWFRNINFDLVRL